MAPGFADRLGADPLGDSADPRLYVPREDTERALAALEAFLEGDEGGPRLALLHGPSGLGKTLLLRVLEARVARTQRVTWSPFLHLGPTEASAWLLERFGVRPLPSNPRDALARLLRGPCEPPRLLIVDEAQAIPRVTAAFLGRILKEAHPCHRVVLSGTDGASLEWMETALGIDACKVHLAAPLDQAELHDLIQAACTHGDFDEAARSVLAHSEAQALLDAASASPQGLKGILVHASRGLLPGPFLTNHDDGSERSVVEELPAERSPARGDPAGPGTVALAERLGAALVRLRAAARGTQARCLRRLAGGIAHARRWGTAARERVARLDLAPMAGRVQRAVQRRVGGARALVLRSQARTGQLATTAWHALLERAKRLSDLLTAARRHVSERTRSALARLGESGRAARERLVEAGRHLRSGLAERGRNVRAGLVEIEASLRQRLVEHATGFRQRLAERGADVRRLLAERGADVRRLLAERGADVRRLLVEHGTILGRRLAERATVARHRLAAHATAVRDLLTTAAAGARQILAESTTSLRLLVLEHGTGIRTTLLLGIALGPLLSFGPHGGSDLAPAPVGVTLAGGVAARPDLPTSVSAAPALPSTPAAAETITIHVNARPWANIWLDGRDLGSTPLSHAGLEPGSYRIEARFPDGRRIVRSVAVGPEARRFSFP